MNIKPFVPHDNERLNLMGRRLGSLEIPPRYYKDTVENANHMAK